MSIGTSATNNFRWYGGTANRETMNLYRTADTSGLVIASRTTSASNNKTYPLLNLISTDNPSSFTGGVSATTNDLVQMTWNDKPSVGFDSQTHRFCFNIGNTQPYKSGYPHTFGITTTGDAICIAPNSTTAVPTSGGNLYLVNDTLSKMVWNTNTPYTDATFSVAPITLDNGGIAIKTSSSYSSSNLDMGLLIRSAHATPVRLGLKVSNATGATSTNAGYAGTISSNDFVLMSNNTERVRISTANTTIVNTLAATNFDLLSTQGSGATSTIMTFGNSTAASSAGEWAISNFNSSSNANCHFSILNGLTGADAGINIGTFSTSGISGGAVMILNNANGTGSFVTCGTSSPSGALYVNAAITRAVPSGWGYHPSGPASIGGGTVAVAFATESNCWIKGNVYCTSDARLKDIVAPIDSSKAMNLLNVEPCWYKWKTDKDMVPQLGFIAQDLVKNDLRELTMVFDNETIENDPEGIIPDGKQLTVAYDRLPLYLLQIIKNLNERVKLLEAKRIYIKRPNRNQRFL